MYQSPTDTEVRVRGSQGFVIIFFRLLFLLIISLFPAATLWSLHAPLIWIIVASVIWWGVYMAFYLLLTRARVRVNGDGTRIRRHSHPADSTQVQTGYLGNDDLRVHHGLDFAKSCPPPYGDTPKTPEGMPSYPPPVSARDAPPGYYVHHVSSSSSWSTLV
ncbi:MAG: hypothetical protein DHS80DRAFT_29969 [Piptocephalis tieghemiana]|nr:MAG: hypothetical protein DHS80DRAFT_29969 [Piptocephalis tieghemiana]